MTVAVPEPAAHELAATDTWVSVIAQVSKLASQVCDTDFVPRSLRGNAPAVTAVILHGRELGLAPMTALQLTNVIDGRVAMSAEGQRSLVIAAGHEIEFTELSDARVVVRGRRRERAWPTGRMVPSESQWRSVEWTLDRAKRAGLGQSSRSAWRTYPRAMLAARASAELCRLMFADVLHGTAATEEISEPETEAREPVTAPTRRVGRAPLAEVEAPPIEAYAPPEAPPRAEPEPPPSPPERQPEAPTVPLPPQEISPAQLRMLHALLNRFGLDGDERVRAVSLMTGRELSSTRELTLDETSGVLNVLAGIVSDQGEDARGSDYRHALNGHLGHDVFPAEPDPEPEQDQDGAGDE